MSATYENAAGWRDDALRELGLTGKRIETVTGDNPWAVWNRRCQNCGRGHCCYFCHHEGCYPPMPAGHTLCARCGQLIFGQVTPMNEAMEICERCESILLPDNA